MGHARQSCPLDGSRLVGMGGAYGEKGMDLSIWYCPPCGVAFVLLSPTRTEAAPSVLQWHWRDGQLELRAEDCPRWEELPRQFRECWASNVRHHVGLFLRGRHAEGVCCPLDGTATPVLQRWRDEAGTFWLRSWCRWCGLGFLFASSDDYGWECCASVTWDAGRGRYKVWKEYPTGSGHAISPPLLAGLPPLPDA